MPRDRFDNYRELRSKFDSVATCGHPIKVGDPIGWLPGKPAKTQCAPCWRRWCAENAEAAAAERGY
jgi:hypothetical protein